MASMTLFLCCGIFFVSMKLDSTLVHGSLQSCPDTDPIKLCEKNIKEATETTLSIKTEAESQSKGNSLLQSYVKMIRENNKTLENRHDLGLDENEAQAVHLFTMDTFKLFDDLNYSLRKGVIPYPAFYYWLGIAITKLPRATSALYRGYKRIVNIEVDTTLHLPGFSSTSSKIEVAQTNFSSPGCTILIFDESEDAGAAYRLSVFPKEYEYIIPPTEIFEVYNKSSDDKYNYIHLKPFNLLRFKRSTNVVPYTLCGGSGAQTFSPFLMAIVLIQRFF